VPSDRELQFALLEFLRKRGRRHKRNTIGRASEPGDLELFLRTTFDGITRARADRVWDRLQRLDLIRSDYSSTTDPEQWVEITETGAAAFERHALDELDEALGSIKPELVEIRDNAWAALDRGDGPALSDAGNAMSELIDQLLHAQAPEADIKAASWFVKEPTARTGVTRKHRARLIMERRHGEADLDRCAALAAAHNAAAGLKHARQAKDRERGVQVLQLVEGALREVLLWPEHRQKLAGDSAEVLG
jgi:hypothetical protein